MRGVLITAIWLGFLMLVQVVRGIQLPRLVGLEEYGSWGALIAAHQLIGALRAFGTGELFVTDSSESEEKAFGQLFGLEITLNVVLMILTLIAAPIVAIIFDQNQLLWLMVALAFVWPAQALQAPLWRLNKDLRFSRLRLLQATDPIVGTAVSIFLAAQGYGAWSLVIGFLAGAWSMAAVALVSVRFKAKPTFTGVHLKSSAAKAGPLWVAAVATALFPFLLMAVTNDQLGLVTVGAIAFASNLVFITQKLDEAVNSVMLPTAANARDNQPLLREAFEKANRAGLAWAMPMAAGLIIFAPDLLPKIMGGRDWHTAVPVVQWFAASMAIGHLGMNWWQFELIAENRRPIAYSGLLTLGTFLVAQAPLIMFLGLNGLCAGIMVHAVVQLIFRSVVISKRFSGWNPIGLFVRAALPIAPAAALALFSNQIGLNHLFNAVVFAVVCTVSTLFIERSLTREAASYLRGAVARSSSRN